MTDPSRRAAVVASLARTRDVGQVIEHAVGRMLRYFRRHGHLEIEHDVEEDDEPEAALCASGVSGREPPASPQWLRGLSPSSPSALAYDKPLCAALDGFTLHAATRAGAHHAAAREALLRYVLRPPIAKERVEPQQDGLVRLAVDKPRQALAPHICDRCPRVPNLQGADEARRHGH